MDTKKHITTLLPSDTGLSLQALTEKLIAVVDMESAATRAARRTLKKAREDLAELQAPFEAERKAISDALCRQMLVIGRPQIRHTLFTFSAFEVETWDKQKLAALLLEIPALQSCVSQRPQSRLLLKD